jgi:predicted amidohydrolase YtcJ
MKTAYYNGIVYTGELPLRRAFIVEDGYFGKTGTNEEVFAALDSGDARVDLEGRFVCPGFNDSHMHLLSFGSVLHTAQLAGRTGSLVACSAAGRERQQE